MQQPPRTWLLVVFSSAVLAHLAAPAGLFAQTPGTSRLQGLVNDLALQLEFSYKGNPRGHTQRYDEMAAALEKWNLSGRSSEDLVAMEQWLEQAIQSAMPGPGAPLPAAPRFTERISTPASTDPQLSEPISPAEASTSAAAVPLADPQRRAPRGQVTAPLAPPSHPATAELAWGDPFVDDPLARGVGRSVQTRRKPTTPGVQIDWGELDARASGYRQGLDSVRAELTANRQPSAFRLAGLTRELESLAEERRFIELYAQSMPRGERSTLTNLPSDRRVVSLLRMRAKDRAEAVDTLRTRQADAERAVLAGLERKLGQISEDE